MKGFVKTLLCSAMLYLAGLLFTVHIPQEIMMNFSVRAASPEETPANETASVSAEDAAATLQEGKSLEYDKYPPLSMVDFSSLTEQMSGEERQAFEEYLPVLTEEESFYFDIDGIDGKIDLGEWYFLMSGSHPIDDLRLYEVAVQDMDGDGSLELILDFPNLGGEYLILHREENDFYGCEAGARSFEMLQKNGCFIASGGATCSHVYRLSFEKEHFVWTETAYSCEWEEHAYVIEGEAVDEAAWEAWFAENFQEEAVWYRPTMNKALLKQTEEKLAALELSLPDGGYIRRVTDIFSREYKIEHIYIDRSSQSTDEPEHIMDYILFYEKGTENLLWVVTYLTQEHRPYENCNFYAHMEDVNFDGREDLLINNGYDSYTAYLQTGEGFAECPEFADNMRDYRIRWKERAIIGAWEEKEGKRAVDSKWYYRWYRFEDNRYQCFYQERCGRYQLNLAAHPERTYDSETYKVTLGVSYEIPGSIIPGDYAADQGNRDAYDVPDNGTLLQSGMLQGNIRENCAQRAYIYEDPVRNGCFVSEKGSIYGIVEPDYSFGAGLSDTDSFSEDKRRLANLTVTFYKDPQFEEEWYAVRLFMQKPEEMLEEITFGDYNADGYLDIGIPGGAGYSETEYSWLIQNPETGVFFRPFRSGAPFARHILPGILCHDRIG